MELAGRVLALTLLLSSAAWAQTTDGAQNETFPLRTNGSLEFPSSEGGIGTTSTAVPGRSTEQGDVATTGIPDVNATSQKILLLTEASDAATTGITDVTTTTSEKILPLTEPYNTTTTGNPDVTTSQNIQLLTEQTTDSPTASPTEVAPSVRPSTLPSFPTVVAPTSATQSTSSATDNVTSTEAEFGSVLLTFRGTCGDLAESVAAQLDLQTAAHRSPFSCDRELRLRLSVPDPGALRGRMGLARVRLGDGPFLTLADVEVLETSDRDDPDYVPRTFATPLSVREVVIYAIVGAVFGLALLTVAGLLCCKCCCGSVGGRKASRDVPRLARRLEDYSLTRIPRPSTLFGARNGAPVGDAPVIRQSFDTSVVPLDERAGSLRRGHLRSFSGRRARPRDSSERDSEAAGSGSPALYGSSERLARDFGPRQAMKGADNQVFRF